MLPMATLSRALLAACAVAMAGEGLAQGPAGPKLPAPPPAGASDAALIEAGRAHVRGAVLATARAELPGGDAAILVASRVRPGGPVAFELLVVGAGEGALALLGHDEVWSGPVFGAPAVALAAGAHPFADGALTATVGWRADDGHSEAQTVLYRYGGGRLSRLLALEPERTFAPGTSRPAERHEIEVLRTSAGGFRDLRVRSRLCPGDGACAEPWEVASYAFDGVRYARRPFALPFVERIEASSELASPGAMEDHSAGAAVDGRADTAWCEGAPGAGWFQRLELTFSPAQRLGAISILPGGGPGEAERDRTRPRRVRALLPDGRKVEAELADEVRPQRIALPGGDRVFGLTLVVVDVYKGKREDACIAELDLEVEP